MLRAFMIKSITIWDRALIFADRHRLEAVIGKKKIDTFSSFSCRNKMPKSLICRAGHGVDFQARLVGEISSVIKILMICIISTFQS
jgi:hypothetical protein